MLLKLIIWAIVLAVIYRAAKSWFGQTGKQQERMTGAGGFSGQVDDVMVKDPFCGIYFPMGEGVSLEHDGRTMHFCGTECRRRFLDEQASKQENDDLA